MSEGPATRRRLRVAEPLEAGTLQLEDQRAHYLREVLRVKAGEALELFDGSGRIALAQISTVTPGGVIVSVGQPQDTREPCASVTVAMAVPKGERADWAMEKLTEVGVSRIVALRCARSVAIPDAKKNRVARWHRLADNAARQSGRTVVPSIEGPMALTEFLAEPADGRCFVADAEGPSLLGETLAGTTEARVLVGPEGGLTADELCMARQAGYYRVSVGPYLLRVETAAVISAATLVQATHPTDGRSST